MKVLLLLGLFGLAACTTVADVITQASGGFHIGESRPTPDGGYQKLVAGFEGWTFWETASSRGLTCYAIKAGGGRLSPVPSPGLGIVTGAGGGFYMRTTGGTLSAGLYGTNAFVKQGRTELGGEIFEALTPELVADWEGQAAFYQVTTGPNFSNNENLRRDIGAIDFTGVRRALANLEACGQARSVL